MFCELYSLLIFKSIKVLDDISPVNSECEWFNYWFVFSFVPAITPMVQNAKAVAQNPRDPAAGSRWRDANKAVRKLFQILSLNSN